MSDKRVFVPVVQTEFRRDEVFVTTPLLACRHIRLDEDGICRSCGKDCRGID